MQDQILRAWKNKGVVYYLILIPLSWLFGIIVLVRRTSYRIGLLQSYQLPVPVIIVGNINLGGSGKTPMVIWLIEQLKQAGFEPGVVSRGYGVNSNLTNHIQARQVAVNSLAAEVGDEPLLIAKRTHCPVWVSKNRVEACLALIKAHPECDVIISDDGLQHYRLQRDIEIAVVDKQSQSNQKLLPAGPLREPFSRLQAVDFIVANGDSDIENATKMQLEGELFYNLAQPERRASVTDFSGNNVKAIAGIGKPERFFDHLTDLGLAFTSRSFDDHYVFSAQDLDSLKCDALIMTEKDAVKCLPFAQQHHWVLPIEAKVDKVLFPLILSKLKQNTLKI